MSATFSFTGGNTHRDSTATITIDGGQDIFRLCVNALNWQCEFGDGARGVLVQLREHLTPARFDPMARSLLGDDRYARLEHCFERDSICCACERTIAPRAKRWPAKGHEAFCYGCHRRYGKGRAA